MRKRVLLIVLFGIHIGVNSQTKIGFGLSDSFDILGNSVAHYGMSKIIGTDNFQYVGLSGYYGLNFYTNGNERIKILKNGNVGIGTTNPLQKLQIGENGFTFHDGGHKVLTFNANTTNFGSIRYDVPNEKFNIETVVNGNSTTQMQIKSTGVVIINHNLGIGTSDPGSWKLAVNGQIRAKEIKVETDWSDFVFEETYKLPTLEEVEKHIKEKGHLKDIPNAAEVAKNGIFLGEMDSKLLQKIEELTLYTIEQQKEIEFLKKELKNILEELKKQK